MSVLLHNKTVYALIPLAHSTVMQEKYENMGVLFKKIKFDTHQWQICGGPKISTILLRQQSGFTKDPC